MALSGVTMHLGLRVSSRACLRDSNRLELAWDVQLSSSSKASRSNGKPIRLARQMQLPNQESEALTLNSNKGLWHDRCSNRNHHRSMGF